MGSQRFFRVLFAACLALTVGACGGGGGSEDAFAGDGSGGTDGGGTDGGGGGTDGGGGTTITPVPRLGLLNGGTFTAGVIAIGQSPLAAGGSSGLRVNVVDTANGNTAITESVVVTYSSACAGAGTSTITPAGVTTTSGTATATYIAQGCSGDDTITATASVGGTALSASGVINVLPATLGSVVFVSAAPTTIFVRGSGATETSVVTFKVLNNVGGPAASQDVAFALDTSVGGIELSSATGKTDANGLVSVTVRSGRVHATPVVTATVVVSGSTSLSGQSAQLAINAGIPDQDSFSLSVECSNVEALDVDGKTVPVTIRAAGRDNNPVSDGRSITFDTEGGSIEGACSTVDGACTVTWTSQDPRPQGLNGCFPGLDANCAVGAPNGASRPGRSTIVAYSVGEESFTDADSDGLRDSNETFNFVQNDLPEAFRDDDEDGNFDRVADAPGNHDEKPIDFNVDGLYTAADGMFNGLYCDAGGNTPVLCALPRSLNVRDSNVIIMSGSSPLIDGDLVGSGGDVFVSGTGVTYSAIDGELRVPDNGVGRIGFVIRDVNDQPMPATTDIAFSISGDGTLLGTSAYKVPCTSSDTISANAYSVSVKAKDLMAGDANGSGLLELKVTTPSGLASVFAFTVVSVAPAALPPPAP